MTLLASRWSCGIVGSDNMTCTIIHLAFAVLFVTGGSRLRAQNLVTNGGFESGWTGWCRIQHNTGP